MKKQTLTILLIVVGMLISAGGCDKAESSQKKYDQREKSLYETIAKLVEVDKTRMDKIVYNFSLVDLGMTKGQAIKTFGFPDYVNCTYQKGLLGFGIYKSTHWEYQRRGVHLYFEDGILTSWQN